MAMIRSRASAGSNAPFRLLYSVREPEAILYRTELQALSFVETAADLLTGSGNSQDTDGARWSHRRSTMSTHTFDFFDGNAAAGELSNIFVLDITAAEGQCANCGATKRFAEAHLYMQNRRLWLIRPRPTVGANHAYHAKRFFGTVPGTCANGECFLRAITLGSP
jgi:hypothetical protein